MNQKEVSPIAFHYIGEFSSLSDIKDPSNWDVCIIYSYNKESKFKERKIYMYMNEKWLISSLYRYNNENEDWEEIDSNLIEGDMI